MLEGNDRPGSLPRRAAGRMLSFLMIATGLTLLGSVLPSQSTDLNRTATLALCMVAIAFGGVMWFIPWQRLPRSAPLAVLPLGFAMITIGNIVDPNPYTYGQSYIIISLWLGASQRRGASLAVLPLAAISYAVPLLNTPNAASELLESALFTLVLAALVGETLAWLMQRLGAAHRELADKRSEARFQALTHDAADIVAIIDPAGQILYCSTAIQSVLDVRSEEVVGTVVGQRIHPEDACVAGRLLEQATGDRLRTHSAEFRVQHRDGSWRHLEATLRDLREEPEIAGLVINARDVTERKSLEHELAHRAYHDALTELPNREMLLDRVGHALARSVHSGDRIAVLFVDLDSFKVINDTLGHQAGDAVLIGVAQRLRAALRAGDTAARTSADEFVLLLEDLADIDGAERVAEQVREQLRQPFELDSQSVIISASIGIALSDASGATLADDLLRQSEVAMSAAKARGKGQIATFNSSMTGTSLDRLALEADLQRALELGEFRVWYQPIVDLGSGQLNGAEALLRWQHPTRGIVPPVEFITAAEETGLIVPIGRWVLREACRQAQIWRKTSDFMISVNLSARQFQHPGLVEDVAAALSDSGLAPAALKLEVTESVAMESGVGTIQTFQALRGLGVRLAIDDFGTGYSSLAYLKRFPVDTLKIDRSFVDGIGSDEQDSAIVRSVVSLARTLGLSVTAEGIETEAQLAALRNLACDEGQGYLFARPVVAEALGELLGAAEAAGDQERVA